MAELAEQVASLRPLIEHIAKKLLQRHHAPWVELEDLIQVGHMGAWRKADRHRSDGGMKLASWCGLHAEYEMRRYIRDNAPATRRDWERGDLTLIDSLDRPLTDEAFTVADTISAPEPDHDLRICVRQALASVYLTRLERRILHLYFVEDLIQAHIAEMTGYSQMHISRLIHQGLEKIRTQELVSVAA